MKTLTNGRVRNFRETFNHRNNPRQENRNNGFEHFNLPPKDDVWIYRSIVIILGLVILIIIAGLFTLSLKRIDVKIELITICTAISSGAIGTLAGLLAPSPNRQ